MTFKEPSPETVRDVLVDRAEYIRILEAKIVEKESEILGRWESEAEYRRLTDAAHDDLRAESVRLSEELGEVLFERDTLRAEVEKKDHDWAGIYAHDMAQVKEQRDKAEAALGGAYTALCALEPLLTTKEQVAHFLRALAFCKYDKHPEWDERVAALRDTTPRVCGCPDCTAPAEPPREEE